MRIETLTLRRGYPWSEKGEITEMKVEVSPGVMLEVHKVPNQRQLVLALNDVVFDHLNNEGILKCL